MKGPIQYIKGLHLMMLMFLVCLLAGRNLSNYAKLNDFVFFPVTFQCDGSVAGIPYFCKKRQALHSIKHHAPEGEGALMGHDDLDKRTNTQTD